MQVESKTYGVNRLAGKQMDLFYFSSVLKSEIIDDGARKNILIVDTEQTKGGKTIRLLHSIIILIILMAIANAAVTPSNVVNATKKIPARCVQELQHPFGEPLILQHQAVRPLDLNLTDPIVFSNSSFEKDNIFQGLHFKRFDPAIPTSTFKHSTFRIPA